MEFGTSQTVTAGKGENTIAGVASIKWTNLLADEKDVESLYDAFNGCHVVFHLSSGIDPSSISGYTKSMVEMEIKATNKVLEACAKTPTVIKCVLTSSLLACIWQEKPCSDSSEKHTTTPLVIDHDSWSQESICKEKKLWYALGKLKAEKEAWRIVNKRETTGFTLATICPGLITGPNYAHNNPTPSIAYLKGHQEMYRNGLLATVNITNLAQAHVYVCHGLRRKRTGNHQRYLCFDRVVGSEVEAEEIQREIGIATVSSYHLSNAKLCRLISSTRRRKRCHHKI